VDDAKVQQQLSLRIVEYGVMSEGVDGPLVSEPVVVVDDEHRSVHGEFAAGVIRHDRTTCWAGCSQGHATSER